VAPKRPDASPPKPRKCLTLTGAMEPAGSAGLLATLAMNIFFIDVRTSMSMSLVVCPSFAVILRARAPEFSLCPVSLIVNYQ
jgi:hypothetical protein